MSEPEKGPWISQRIETPNGGPPTTVTTWITDDKADPHKEEIGPIAWGVMLDLQARLDRAEGKR